VEDRWLPGETITFGRAAIGETRPNPRGAIHVMKQADDRPKAKKTGIYIVKEDSGTETHLRIKEGDFLPEGATWRDEGAEREPSLRERERAAILERSKGAAPENRAKTAPKDAT
jgi:hypothetical protein